MVLCRQSSWAAARYSVLKVLCLLRPQARWGTLCTWPRLMLRPARRFVFCRTPVLPTDQSNRSPVLQKIGSPVQADWGICGDLTPYCTVVTDCSHAPPANLAVSLFHARKHLLLLPLIITARSPMKQISDASALTGWQWLSAPPLLHTSFRFCVWPFKLFVFPQGFSRKSVASWRVVICLSTPRRTTHK